MNVRRVMEMPKVPLALWIISVGVMGFFGYLIFKHPAKEAGSHAYLEYGFFALGILMNPIVTWAIGISIKSITGPAIGAWRAYQEAKK